MNNLPINQMQVLEERFESVLKEYVWIHGYTKTAKKVSKVIVKYDDLTDDERSWKNALQEEELRFEYQQDLKETQQCLKNREI